MAQLYGAAYSGNEHVNAPLSEISFKYRNEEMVSEFIFPAKFVAKKSDLFYKLDKTNLRFEGGAQPTSSQVPARRAQFGLTTDEYKMTIGRLYDVVTDEDRENQDDPLDLDAMTVENITDILNVGKEEYAADLVQKYASYTGGNASLAPTKWDASTAGNPMQQIEDAAQTIRKNTGTMPNAIVFSANAFGTGFLNNPFVVDRFKHVREGAANLNAVASYFPWVEAGNIAVAGMVKRTGVSDTQSDVWGASTITGAGSPTGKGMVLIFTRDMAQVNSPMRMSRTMSFGKCFRFQNDSIVTTTRVGNPPGDMHHIRKAYGFKVLDYDCAYLLANVIS